MQSVHLSEREATDKRTTLLLLAQDCRADEFGRRRPQSVEAERNAAHPAIVNISRQMFRRRRSALIERRQRILDASAGRQHHHPPGTAVRQLPRVFFGPARSMIIDQTIENPNFSPSIAI